jgi:hypothetical protein
MKKRYLEISNIENKSNTYILKTLTTILLIPIFEAGKDPVFDSFTTMHSYGAPIKGAFLFLGRM